MNSSSNNSVEKSPITHKNNLLILSFVIGLVLFIVSWNIDNSLQNTECKSTSLKTSNKLVFMISNILLTISTMCLLGKLDAEILLRYVSYITIFLGLLLIVLGTIINIQSNTDDCVNQAGSGWIWSLGLLLFLLSSVDLYYKHSPALLIRLRK
jgi:hypothetical protein